MNLYCEDIEFEDGDLNIPFLQGDGWVSAYTPYNFDFAKQNGIVVEDSLDTWVNTYIYYNYLTYVIIVRCFVETDTSCEEYDYKPTAMETYWCISAVRELMKCSEEMRCLL